jgi:hypothetical protein
LIKKNEREKYQLSPGFPNCQTEQKQNKTNNDPGEENWNVVDVGGVCVLERG